MAWIESHEEIWDHHKVIRLCTAVGQPDYAVVGRLFSLWHFVLRNAWRDANLEPWGDEGIERASRWDGEKGVFVAALRECGFLDGFVVHGWQKRAGRLVQDRRRNELRKRRRTTGGKPAVNMRCRTGKLAATVPNPTLPNLTIPKDKDIVPHGTFTKPSLNDLKAYCLERRNDVDPEKFLAHYESNGWKVGRNSMRDWKAAVRTWEKSEFAQGVKNGQNGRGSYGDRLLEQEAGRKPAKSNVVEVPGMFR